MSRLLFTFFLISCFSVYSQLKPIDHTAYDSWKRIERHTFSPKGNFVSYEIIPLKGDGFLYLYNNNTHKLDSFPRGKEAKWASDESFLVYTQTPGYDTLRKCELNKVAKSKWPKDSVFVVDLSNDTLLKLNKLKTFEVAEKGNVLAYLLDHNKLIENDPDKVKYKRLWYWPFKKVKVSSSTKRISSDGNRMVVWNAMDQIIFEANHVVSFKFSENGEHLAYIQHKNGKKDTLQMTIWNTNSKSEIHQFPKVQSQKLPIWNKDLSKIAFLSGNDTSEIKRMTLNVYTFLDMKTRVIGDTLEPEFDTRLAVSENRELLFTDNGKYLFFGVAEMKQKAEKDTLLESEKVNVDVWHYLDEKIQPQQLVELKEAKKYSDWYVLNFETDSVFQVSADSLRIRPKKNWEGDYLLALNPKPYRIESQWKSPSKDDVYRVSLKDGKTELIKKAVENSGNLSPSGRYYDYFDGKSVCHRLIDLENGKDMAIDCGSKNNYAEWLNGLPMLPDASSRHGFFRGEKLVIVATEFQVFAYDIANSQLLPLTQKLNPNNEMKLEWLTWESDSLFEDLSNVYIKGRNEKTKAESLFLLKNLEGDFLKIWSDDAKVNSVERSKDGAKFLFRKMTVTQYPDLWLMDADFKEIAKISTTNPQQAEYAWPGVTLVNWKTKSGESLEGLLYFPNQVAKGLQYPMLVYYYETMSEILHNYQSPRPSASTINPVEYASAGYFVFIPNIHYQAGKPGQSAFDCVVSGTDFITQNYPIDTKRLGLQGQSWGGYQTVQLITMTNKFAAAEAGAPVGNMTSAYGGIRWGTGINRQFQYESTQSRIGKNLWEGRDAYIANSPVFHLDKVTTPLLIMHNDKDGAVPWYQGIEIYTGMRRLGKPCWLLNYNDDDHNLTKLANKYDLSIRMRQFFDHYLMGKPAPLWMVKGIPALEKGKTMGYEIDF